jgi:CRISPR type I-D-associated protein Csc2
MAAELLKSAKLPENFARVLVEKPEPLAGRQTIQLVLVREVQDYTVLRTEETRELNTVWTPANADGTGDIERVAFLAGKQKAAESRELEALLRTWSTAPRKECYLKSSLCMECPRCVLFGATDVSGSAGKRSNIKHRIAYATAFSLLPVDPSLREVQTFNGVDGATQLTDQALGERESVRPGSLFASIVTLRAVSELELVLAIKTILSCTRYGAETRVGGIVRNHLVGVVVADEEIISPLELTLALGDGVPDPRATTAAVLEDFKKKASTPARVHVLTTEELGRLVEAVQNASGPDLVEHGYRAAQDFRKQQEHYRTKDKKKNKKEKGRNTDT